MKRLSVGLIVVAFTVAACGHYLPQQGWVELFDGTNATLGNWDRLGGANWRIEDGAVVADKSSSKGASFLVSKNSYKDFEVRIEFWSSDDANSGIFMRCQNVKDINDENCYEANIFDQRPDPAYRTGGVVHRARPAAQVNAGGRWNTYDITARGPRITVSLNGVPMVDVQNSELTRGPIALQYAAGTVKFRSVRVRPL